MKTKLAIMAIALLTMQAASAQFRLGPKAGANLVKVEGKSFKDEFRYNYHLGGFAEIALTQDKKLSLQPEVLFNQYSTTLDSSFKAVYEDIITSEQSRVKLNYLSIPILLNYRLAGPIYLQAGPAFSILMDQHRSILQNGGDAFKKGDFSMIGGAQIKIAKIYLTGRYVVGLANINDIDDKDKWKSQAIQLSVGLSL
ncbi:MAG TPA: porin family protein [Chitinophagaceae bacterium]|nr:porin family protein [Chitinophagaceae bacterium]